MNKKIILLVIAFVLGFTIYFFTHTQIQNSQKPIKVGILHSLTGTMAISEKSVVDATLLAIEEINAKGGILGRKIQPIIVDGKSDWNTFAKQAKNLITKEKVVTVFGCWTSASRKTVKPIFEIYNHLLIYPVQYEGLEESPNIVYTGAAPNQQIIPAVKWSFDNLGKRFFLVGSDYIFPRTANAIIKDQVTALKGEILGEEYILLGSNEVNNVVAKILKTQPDVILNTINGDSNIAFFKTLRQAGISSDIIPTISFSIAEEELKSLPNKYVIGDYAVWNYFQTINNPNNSEFTQNFQKKYGKNRVTSDPIEAGYFGVYLWAQAVKAAGIDEVNIIREYIKDQSFNAPEGVVYIDANNQHTWKTVRVGKIQSDGQFKIVWNSGKPIRPIPYPISRSKAEWEIFITNLYRGWNRNWANPNTN
ncbi:urea ABC transporter substrate-binding protein [Anabaena cylindrica FACHB-243]|uniref:Urea-binding protein n=1 Tax=Anabaena cylindrica (strain ATCC 27899 / PCC 7122) TaxID=272123 RepID=K9ZD89_ANACC|nr:MULTISPECIES: urea ABC transporter substrate-binding protein [Anabaena]AFZ57151.1 urea-binding protein [Anabaena cylindrica PCC 7122]MBD2418036.1 urea ABC transporter substrate-binding protein [Anabaena cylindrica FACHB-243]MBY5283490.1 urea ABC transporter substrate-binding protein [Anabaena sp. CCAP 1446/1C]MBY5309672.1 urea ABC transporter substrate-binding protein [Anabaena sp. CCAP 1446/1C]MCM2408758.1 urea ABC transporter substrate-binding protein [Anabaena sp. CCAP 1446/1C]